MLDLHPIAKHRLYHLAIVSITGAVTLWLLLLLGGLRFDYESREATLLTYFDEEFALAQARLEHPARGDRRRIL